MSRIVVTGCAGFVGSHLVERLLADGHEVTGVDCLTDYYDPGVKRANLSAALGKSSFRFVERDLLDLRKSPDGLIEAFLEAERIYHLAAQAGVRASWGTNFSTYTDNNVLATQLVLEACLQGVPKQVIYASSSSVYGDCPVLPLTEDVACRPVSPYGVTKLAGEHLSCLYAQAHGLHTVSLRFFTVYGPRQRPDMAFHKFMRALLCDEPIEVYGSGEQTRDFTFVDDIIEMLVRAPQAPAGSVINAGGGHRVTLLRTLEILAEITGRSPRLSMKRSERGDARDTWADLSRTQQLLGYTPRTGLTEGLTAEWDWIQRV